MNTTTMSGIYFHNPIKTLNRLKEAGLSDKAAEAHVEILSEYVEQGLVTKQDLESKLKELELRLTIKTTTIVASIVGFFSFLEKFIK